MHSSQRWIFLVFETFCRRGLTVLHPQSSRDNRVVGKDLWGGGRLDIDYGSMPAATNRKVEPGGFPFQALIIRQPSIGSVVRPSKRDNVTEYTCFLTAL